MRTYQLFITITHACLLFNNCVGMDPVIEEIEKDIHEMKHDMGTIISMLSPTIGQYISGEELPAIQNNPYKQTTAHVRQGVGISSGEKEYLKNRLPIAKESLEKVLARELPQDQVPVIAVIGSGGGYRALLYKLGSLVALKKIKLLDAMTYITALSGSTWAVAPWISTGMPIKQFKEYIINCVEKPFTQTTDAEELLIFAAAAVKTMYHQPRNLVDLYGDLLGNRFLEYLGEKRHITYLSEQAEKIKSGKYPYPIYTAIDADEKIVENQTWYEITPHEVGNPIDNVYIPTWAFGRKFKRGKSIDYAPERNLDGFMGMFGSAFGASIHTIKKELIKKLGHEEFLEKLLISLDGERPIDFYAEIANYAYKLNPENKGPKHKTFVDAGLDCNLPFSPVSGLCPERKADIFLVIDASAGTIGHELKKAADYMTKHGLPFPKINFENIDKETMSVFYDENNPLIPTVIYQPRISDQQLWKANKSNPEYATYKLSKFDLNYETNHGFAQTIHFQYKAENARKVIEQAEFNMRVNQTKLINAINQAIERKKLAK